MSTGVAILFALMLILFGAELFTNAVEWLGELLGLGQGAIGSVLAAIGTALPETAVPATAILFGTSKDAENIGVGGILGAPFLLATMGSLVMAMALLLARKRPSGPTLQLGKSGYGRDMKFFLIAYALAMAAGCLANRRIHHVVALALVGIYLLFVVVTVRDKSDLGTVEKPHHLYLSSGNSERPRPILVLLQLAMSLGMIIGGAHILTGAVERLSGNLQLPAFVVSALLIPLATELPETLNSVVWIRKSRDSLAVGNITGAMVFQSTLVPALGIWLTPWQLTPDAILTGTLTIAAAAFTLGVVQLTGQLTPSMLIMASTLYFVLPMISLSAASGKVLYVAIFAGVILLLLLLASRSRQWRAT
ncbi:MAG: sodium:calcium antiporter [Alicyclobacillaceae bacterium]|nr:sodium:calcium antiporter [Alicyclobacillaceae bacterium]